MKIPPISSAVSSCRRGFIPSLLAASSLLALTACPNANHTFINPFGADYDRPTSGWGLRKLDPKDYPDMRQAWMDTADLERAIDKSIQFLNAPSSNHFYPSPNPGDTITHAQVLASLQDIKSMLHQNLTPDQFQQQIVSRYDVYTSVGFDDKGGVWFTGYFTPIYQGSLTKTAEFQYPLYSRPADLATDPTTGEVIDPVTHQPKKDYPTRKELLASGKLNGLELCYFRKPIEPFIIQIQGSAKVSLPNGQTLYLGYAGTNGRDHKGLGAELVKDKKIDAAHLSLPTVLAYFDAHPNELDQYVLRDDRFTFLKPYSPEEWPSGSLGVQVTPDRSLATDKSIFPRASLTFIDVAKPNATGQEQPYKGLLLDQDTGGAIRAAGRADIYMGIGDQASLRAGHEFNKGRLYYIFLKPQPLPATTNPNLHLTPPGNPAIPATRPGDADMFPGAIKK